MNHIGKLLKVVPPAPDPKNVGTMALWHKVKAQADLPDWLFDLFHAYGSGLFAVFNDSGEFWDSIYLLNVFEKPLLAQNVAEGIGLVRQNKLRKEPFLFFPEVANGLFPITCSDQGRLLLIDPTDERTVFVTERFLTYLDRFEYGLVDFLCLAFTGAPDFGYVAMSKETRISRVKFCKHWKDAYKTP
jgi:hypothetical protein